MAKKGNIALFTMNNSLSGAEKRFIKIASEMCKDRNDVYLIINYELYNLALNDVELKEKIEILESRNCIQVLNKKGKNYTRYLRVFSNILELLILIKRFNIKILHCALAALKYTKIKKITSIKVLAEITSPDVADQFKNNSLYRRLLDGFDKIITVSESVENRTIRNLREIKKEHLIANIHCSSIPFFLPIDLSWPKFEDKENLIVFASRFIERKHPTLFAKAVKKLLEEKKDWNVAILGKGPLEKEVKQLMAKFIEEQRVVVEYTKDIYSYLKRSKIFVSLIYPDNYPSQSVLEAMYMKNAIVATDVGNTSKLVTENNGFLINGFDVDKLYGVLIEAISNQVRLMNMGEYSSKYIKEKFSSKIYLKELEEVYDEILESH